LIYKFSDFGIGICPIYKIRVGV